MQKYFLNDTDFNNNQITTQDAYQIAKVLRTKVGAEALIGFNNESYKIKFTNINEKCVSYEIIEKLNINNELDVYVTIIQGYPKGDKFEDIIKHGTELGAYEFIPLLSDRSQFNVDDKRKTTKIERFNKITKEAAEQSYRNYVPKVTNFMKLKDIDFSKYDHVFLCYEESAKNNELIEFKTVVKNIKTNEHICFIVGPEGGISEKEYDYFKNNNYHIGALGKRILRTETAVFYILSSISYERELKNV